MKAIDTPGQWADLEAPTRNAAQPIPAPVCVRMRAFRRGPTRMEISISVDIANQICNRAYRFKVQVGWGITEHQMRIVQDDMGNFEAVARKNPKTGEMVRITIALGHNEKFPDKKIPWEGCEFKIDKAAHAIIITLPAWAWMKKYAA